MMPSKDNCLATVNPELSKEWHPTKNGELTPYDVTTGSGKKVYWLCEKGHEWEATVNLRSRIKRNSACPYCAGRKVCNDNCLATVNPQMAKEWHPTKNGELTPYDVTTGSGRNVYWICEKGHEWETKVFQRRLGGGCPYCAGMKVCDDNCLATVNPQMAKEWHPTKNGELTPYDVTTGSASRVWWICEKNHEWDSVVATRTYNKSGCPYCAKNRKWIPAFITKRFDIWTRGKFPYETAGKIEVCNMIQDELIRLDYYDLNFLSLPGNGREIKQLVDNGFELNYDDSRGVERKRFKQLGLFFKNLWERGELGGVLPIIGGDVDRIILDGNIVLPQFNAVHLDYNGSLTRSHVLAVEKAIVSNPDAVVVVTVKQVDRWGWKDINYNFGEFPFINIDSELLFYQPYKGIKGQMMETYCFTGLKGVVI